ncbi:MAG: MFS transporter [bacterium]
MNLTQRYGVAIVFALAGLYFFSFIQRVGIPGSIFNDLQSEMNLDAAVVTRLGAIYLFIYAIMQPFAGMLADRFGGIRVALVSGLLLVIGATLFPLSHSTVGLYSSRALVGLGGSAMFLCMYKEADHSFSGRHFTVIVGFLSLVGYCGGLAGTRPFRMLVDGEGWRNACLVLAAGTASLLVLVWWLGRKADHEGRSTLDGNSWGNTVEVLTNRLNYPVLIAYSFSMSVTLCLQMTIGQKFIEDICGVTASNASKLTFTMMLFTLAALPLCGVISKKFHHRRNPFLIFVAVTAVTGMLLILVGIHYTMPPWYFLCAFIPPALGSGCAPVILSMMKEQNPSKAVATSVGMLNTAAYVMIAVTAQLTGMVLDLFNHQAVVSAKARIYPPSAYVVLFSILLALSLVALIASFFSREIRPRNILVDGRPF